jgi:DNA-binding NarL/FixJ family response regulator
MRTIRVAVQASDRIGLAGLTGFLAARPELEVVSGPDCDVIVVAVDRAGPETVALLRDRAEHPVVLVAADVPGGELLRLVECGVVAILPRRGVTGEQVLAAVLAAASGGATMPSRLLGDLLRHVGRLQREVLAPQRFNACGVTPREVDVLRLMADGWDTEDIADKLSYSTRTVKNLVYALTSRLGLRNRAHAVAYALDAGII